MELDDEYYRNLHIRQEINRAERLMKECENKSLYIQAENHRRTIQQLRKDIAVPLTDQQFQRSWEQAIQSVLHSNRQRWNDFELVWAAKLREHDIKTKAALESIQQKHRNRIHDLTQLSERGIRYPKWSNKLLELRKRQYLLGKTRRYLEAEQIKMQADALENTERLAILEAIDKDVKMKSIRLEKQRQKEVQICKDKMELERQCILEGRQQMAKTLKCQCDRSVDLVKNRNRQSAAQRQLLLQ